MSVQAPAAWMKYFQFLFRLRAPVAAKGGRKMPGCTGKSGRNNHLCHVLPLPRAGGTPQCPGFPNLATKAIVWPGWIGDQISAHLTLQAIGIQNRRGFNGNE